MGLRISLFLIMGLFSAMSNATECELHATLGFGVMDPSRAPIKKTLDNAHDLRNGKLDGRGASSGFDEYRMEMNGFVVSPYIYDGWLYVRIEDTQTGSISNLVGSDQGIDLERKSGGGIYVACKYQ